MGRLFLDLHQYYYFCTAYILRGLGIESHIREDLSVCSGEDSPALIYIHTISSRQQTKYRKRNLLPGFLLKG